VADLGGGALGAIAPLREKFFDFFQQKRTKNELMLPRMDPKKYFLLTTAPPFEKKCPPPLQNPRSATVIYMNGGINVSVSFFSTKNIMIILCSS